MSLIIFRIGKHFYTGRCLHQVIEVLENNCVPARALSLFENCHFWSHRPPKFSIHQVAPIKNGQFLVGAT